MNFSSKSWSHYGWFFCGFLFGLTLISLGHASLPSRVNVKTNAQKGQASTILTEIKGGKVASPELDQDLSRLNSLESRFAESSIQQQRLKNATARAARGSLKPTQKK